MARKVTINAINSELRLATNGITLRVEDDSGVSGRLRIGKATVSWTPRGKGNVIGGRNTRSKTWAQLVHFLTH